ncbi:MAG: glycoside hydrolase family 25 protein [Crocinitomicaceae bacterium]
MRQNVYLIISLALAIFVVLLLFDQRNHSNLTFPDFGAALPAHYQVLGIDVSHHQGQINWEQVSKMKIKNDSIQFVFLKLTEGVDFKDKYALVNRKALDQREVPYGGYHFYSPGKSAILQAKFFVENYTKSKLKPVLDIEVKGQLSVQSLNDSIIVFLNFVEQQLNVRPIIYTYESFFTDFFQTSSLAKEWFWIANYTGSSNVFESPNVIAWQFTDKGTIDGIKEKVDLNTAKPNFWKAAAWGKK